MLPARSDTLHLSLRTRHKLIASGFHGIRKKLLSRMIERTLFKIWICLLSNMTCAVFLANRADLQERYSWFLLTSIC